MGFYREPIIEEPPLCMVCHVVVGNGDLICSATCEDLWGIGEQQGKPLLDWEEAYS